MSIIDRATVLQVNLDKRIANFNNKITGYDLACLGFYILLMASVISYYYYCIYKGQEIMNLNVPGIYHPFHFLGLSLIVFSIIVFYKLGGKR